MKTSSKAYRLEKGFQFLRRDRHLTALKFKLDDSEYRLWDLLNALYDWDKRHKNYKHVEVTLADLSRMTRWSITKVSRVMNKLLKKELILKKEESFYEIKVVSVKNADDDWIDFSEVDRWNFNGENNNSNGASKQTQNSFSNSSSNVDINSNLKESNKTNDNSSFSDEEVPF
ncbi:MAG: hypothetical protein WC720_01210 [Candidatus Shapirobacteria bacterium]|jgi:hypothetical protein